MTTKRAPRIRHILFVSSVLTVLLLACAILGLCTGSSGLAFEEVVDVLLGKEGMDPTVRVIIQDIRLPRVLLAALAGGALSIGGLAYQAVLRNPLAEPYILGVSGGAAIGAILGIMLRLPHFPGVCAFAFLGGVSTIFLVIVATTGRSRLKKETLLLAGVMVNAFCSAVILFLISMTQNAQLHSVIYWLMGSFSLPDMPQVIILAAMLVPGFILLFILAHPMNLLLMGEETAASMGVRVKVVTIALLAIVAFMVSAVVSHCGLLGFVGLVVPHSLRLLLGADHRTLAPACVLGGGAYMIVCDVLARTLPEQGEIPVGVITAIIGAPLFILLLRGNRR
jgi:iron complex transport system permease protein